MKSLIIFFLLGSSIIYCSETREIESRESSLKEFSHAFQGPKGWKQFEGKLPENIAAAYVGKGRFQIPPSINLAIEKTTLDIGTYIKKTKQLHEKQPGTLCSIMGDVTTNSGKARLLQIESDTQFGKVQFLQAIVIKNAAAYVITATAQKEEFSQLYLQFFQSIKSLSID